MSACNVFEEAIRGAGLIIARRVPWPDDATFYEVKKHPEDTGSICIAILHDEIEDEGRDRADIVLRSMGPNGPTIDEAHRTGQRFTDYDVNRRRHLIDG